jgi:hypothetical protein
MHVNQSNGGLAQPTAEAMTNGLCFYVGFRPYAGENLS